MPTQKEVHIIVSRSVDESTEDTKTSAALALSTLYSAGNGRIFSAFTRNARSHAVCETKASELEKSPESQSKDCDKESSHDEKKSDRFDYKNYKNYERTEKPTHSNDHQIILPPHSTPNTHPFNYNGMRSPSHSNLYPSMSFATNTSTAMGGCFPPPANHHEYSSPYRYGPSHAPILYQHPHQYYPYHPPPTNRINYSPSMYVTPSRMPKEDHHLEYLARQRKTTTVKKQKYSSGSDVARKGDTMPVTKPSIPAKYSPGQHPQTSNKIRMKMLEQKMRIHQPPSSATLPTQIHQSTGTAYPSYTNTTVTPSPILQYQQTPHHPPPLFRLKTSSPETPKRARTEVTAKSVSPQSKKPRTYSRKDKSLGLLCENFMTKYGETDNQSAYHNGISIDTAASELCVERRRIYDVINILESVEIVSRRFKNTYNWHGKIRLVKVFLRLQREAVKMWPEDANANGMSLIKVNEGPRSTRFLEMQQQSHKEKSLGKLTQKFIQLFLVGHEVINLSFASEKILGFPSPDGGNDEALEGMSNDKGMKTKVRRLYDIANVMISIGIISKVAGTGGNSNKNKPSLTWSYFLSPEDLSQMKDASNLHVPKQNCQHVTGMQQLQLIVPPGLRVTDEPSASSSIATARSIATDSTSMTAGNMLHEDYYDRRNDAETDGKKCLSKEKTQAVPEAVISKSNPISISEERVIINTDPVEMYPPNIPNIKSEHHPIDPLKVKTFMC